MFYCIITVRQDKNFLDENVLFCNGITQNVILLHDMLKLAGERGVEVCVGILYNKTQSEIWNLEEIQSKFTVYTKQDLFCMTSEFNANLKAGDTVTIVEAGETLDPGISMLMHQFKTVVNPRVNYKIIGYRMSHDFAMDQEIIFIQMQALGRIRNSQNMDKLIYSEHHTRSVSYGKHLYNCEALTVPHIWEPCFKGCAARFDKSVYINSTQPPDIVIMEPNISVLKNCLLPLIAINSLMRRDESFRGLFNKVRVLNGNASHATNGELPFHKNRYFHDNVLTNCEYLTSQHDVVYFEHRQSFKDTFQSPAVLVTYQHDNELNYLYFEALHSGIPFVHNSKRIGVDLGYYYEDCNVDHMQRSLLRALRDFKLGLWAVDGDAYGFYEACLQKHSITNQKNQDIYIKCLRD